jgi:hypothetical protein
MLETMVIPKKELKRMKKASLDFNFITKSVKPFEIFAIVYSYSSPFHYSLTNWVLANVMLLMKASIC